MNIFPHALLVLFCLPALSCRPQAPAAPGPPPACFTGVGAIASPSPAPSAAASGKEAYGIGGLGEVSATSSRSGEGTISLGSGKPVYTVYPGQPSYQGAIERDDLRRTVRGHISELASCPDSVEIEQRAYGGRIVVDFVIDPQGRVERSSIRSSTSNEPKVDACIGQQACRWTFAAPRDGGKAVVSYPLVFAPEKRR